MHDGIGHMVTPWADTPLGRPPPGRPPPPDMVNQQAVRILLECILVLQMSLLLICCKVNILLINFLKSLLGAGPEFPKGAYQPQNVGRQIIIRPKFPENCMEIKKLGREEGVSKICLCSCATVYTAVT